MKAKAVVFDLDGTLLRNDKSISSYTTDVLRRTAAAGIHVIPASGRAHPGIAPYVEQLGCASAYIACNGAEIWTPRHERIHQETLSVELARICAAFAEENACHAQVYYGDKFYYSRSEEYARTYEQSSMMQGVHAGDLRTFIDRPTSKFLMTDDPERIAVLYAMAQERFAGMANITCSSTCFLEINPLRASKGIALAEAGKLLGFDVSEAVAFGDGLNDMSMLQTAGMGVAMDNAWQQVKDMIPVHCRSNMEDGVARFIEENILTEVNV